MSVRKLLLLSFLILILFLPSFGEKQQQPLPLSELQNPKGPSYVPIPYPKNREEIIIDLLYAVEYHFGPNKKLRYYGIPSGEDELMSKLLGAKPELHVGEIITAANKTLARSEKYFVMDILYASGEVAARVSLEDCGLYAGAGFSIDGFHIKPLLSLSDTREFFAKNRVSKLAGAKVESIEYESFGSYPVAHPFLKINTDTGIFYMDSRYKVFEVMGEKTFSSEKELLKFTKDMYAKYGAQNLKQPFDSALLDSHTLDVFFLKVVE